MGDNKLTRIREVAEKQYELYLETGCSDDMIAFDFEGMNIINPFVSESGMEKVDPIRYYGDAFLGSNFVKILGLD